MTRIAIPLKGNVLDAGYLVETWDRSNVLRHTVVSGRGEILTSQLRTASDGYRIFPVSPGVGPQIFVNAPADPGASPAGWLGLGTTTTGNNVDAYLDRDANDLPDVNGRPTGPGQIFDFAWDGTVEPTTVVNQNLSVTNLFYLTNLIHDRLYSYGFTESAGNFQTDNFGRGGLANDPLNAEAQDGGGADNANFATPDDGLRPRMQMYLWDQSTPGRDGALDSDIVFHEYTHGLTWRMVGDMSGAPASAVGEGMSDAIACYFNNDDRVAEWSSNNRDRDQDGAVHELHPDVRSGRRHPGPAPGRRDLRRHALAAPAAVARQRVVSGDAAPLSGGRPELHAAKARLRADARRHPVVHPAAADRTRQAAGDVHGLGRFLAIRDRRRGVRPGDLRHWPLPLQGDRVIHQAGVVRRSAERGADGADLVPGQQRELHERCVDRLHGHRQRHGGRHAHASLLWSSNLQGALGTGGSFSRTDLVVGTHVITAAVTDSQGSPGSASITIVVNATPNTAPSVSISQPANGTTFTKGQAVTFSGSASDWQDGNLTASIAWTSSLLQGALGTGGTFSRSDLVAGTHIISAKVTDSGNLSQTAQVAITISNFTLAATKSTVKGKRQVALAWSGATGTTVGIYRDNALLVTAPNSGKYTDANLPKKGNTFAYKVCLAATPSVCSNSVSVTF